jgi:DNA polymerase-3 subunit gamma/tau
VARILAKALNCEAGPTPHPDNTCQMCREITNGSSLDVLEIDGASNRGIDEVRDLREKIKYLPAQGKYKVYIIDEVHMLTKEAFNALLKTLEEPPAHVLFMFATTEPHKIPITILSRCQRFDLRRIRLSSIANHLAPSVAGKGGGRRRAWS